jgi:hypothetical protein
VNRCVVIVQSAQEFDGHVMGGSPDGVGLARCDKSTPAPFNRLALGCRRDAVDVARRQLAHEVVAKWEDIRTPAANRA